MNWTPRKPSIRKRDGFWFFGAGGWSLRAVSLANAQKIAADYFANGNRPFGMAAD